MGYQMFTSPRLERLVEAHLDQFEAKFFAPRPLIVIQNQSLAQWMKLFLARARGGYATGDFVFQDELLRRLIETVSDEPVLFIDNLKYELYRELSLSTDPALDPLLGGSREPARLFELADHLAGVFHGYAMNSRLWPAALSSGSLPRETGADPETFGWQSALWRALLGHRTLAGLVLEKLTREVPRPSGPPRRVVIVGSAFLSRRAAAFLSAWAEGGLIDVVHLLLLPSVLPGGEWPTTRPWSSWGAFGKAFLEALPAPAARSDSEGGTALRSLQESLATGQPFAASPDGTIQVASSPHPLRELEVLRDRLLAALADDASLEVNDIAVLAPDINVYAPFLEAAFASDDPGRNLRFHVIDLDLGRENAWFRALDALLTLLGPVIERPALFALIDSEPFREAWNLEDEKELWLEYTEAVSAWREEAADAPQSWSASWDRLFEGWFRSEPDALVPPLDTSPSAFRGLGRFHELLSRLRGLAAEARHPRNFLDWVRFLEDAAAAFLTADDAGTALWSRLRILAENENFELPWAGFRSFVQDQVAHFPGRRGQLLTEGVHCSSLKPLRAIPFRVVAVLGLDEGAFPRRDLTPSFDLSRHEPGNEALSASSQDRYCFWETIMAARDALYLSYRGRTADGTKRPPSSVLADLLDHLGTETPWPVAEVSANDFSAEGGITWSRRTRRRAEAVRSPSLFLPLPSPAAEASDPFPEVNPADVALAFVRPAKFHLQRVRQLNLREEDRRGVDDEEPWSVPFLERHAWLGEQLEKELEAETDWNADAYVTRAVALGKAREGVFADRDRNELAERATTAAAWARELRLEGWRPAEPRRTLWANLPWSGELGFDNGGDFLVARLLYGKQTPERTQFEAALAVLQRLPEGEARLSTLNPAGKRADSRWSPSVPTEELARTAEAYWREAVSRPLPFYPDLLKQVRRHQSEDLPWAELLQQAWEDARDADFGTSESVFSRDPYARLAFAEDPDWDAVATKLERWWRPLFLPLLEAWK